MNKTKEHYHSLLKVTTFRVSPSSIKITKLSQKKSRLRRNEKGTCQSTSTNASQLVKKKKNNGMKKYTQSKPQSKKSANQKTIKRQKILLLLLYYIVRILREISRAINCRAGFMLWKNRHFDHDYRGASTCCYCVRSSSSLFHEILLFRLLSAKMR